MALTHKPLILKNYMVNTLLELLNIPLQANLSRSRNRFILLFTDTAKQIEADRMAILKKWGDLKDGELQIGVDGKYKLTDADAFNKEFEEMTTRTLAVPCVGEMLTDFHMVKNILDTLETKLTVAQTTVYDEIMQAFEAWAGSDQGEHHEGTGAAA